MDGVNQILKLLVRRHNLIHPHLRMLIVVVEKEVTTGTNRCGQNRAGGNLLADSGDDSLFVRTPLVELRFSVITEKRFVMCLKRNPAPILDLYSNTASQMTPELHMECSERSIVVKCAVGK